MDPAQGSYGGGVKIATVPASTRAVPLTVMSSPGTPATTWIDPSKQPILRPTATAAPNRSPVSTTPGTPGVYCLTSPVGSGAVEDHLNSCTMPALLLAPTSSSGTPTARCSPKKPTAAPK